jgi:hypothetical protein
MAAARSLVLAASFLVGSVTPAAAQSTADLADIQRAVVQLSGEDRVDQALGAIAAQHVIKRQWRFNLLARTEPRWWQKALLPAVPRLVHMLGDNAGLEWIDQNGMTEQVTTPRKEATLALVGLERVSIVPLIAAMDRPRLSRRADEVLRRITGDRGPADKTSASWQAWWQANQDRPLPREHGQLPSVFLGLVLLAAAVTGVIFLQRKLLAPRPGPTLSARPPVEAPPAPAAEAPPKTDQAAPSGQ